MKKLFILTLLILSGLSTNSFANKIPLKVEVTTKNTIEKSCSMQLYDDFLVIEQKISNERNNDALVVQFTYRHSAAGIRISGNWVDSYFQKSKRLFLDDKSDINIEKIIASEEAISILEELLNGTGFAQGQSGSFWVNATTIANAFREKCK